MSTLDPERSRPSADGTVILDGRRRRNVLIAVCAGLMAVQSSVSGLNVAQTELAVDLGISHGTILWIINAYTLALAALLMPVGAVGDRWGRRPVLLLGLGLFLAASVGAGLATSGAFMIGARVTAGVAAAMIMPVTLSVITTTFPADERSRAIGIWAGVAGSGGLVGILASSFMVDLATWRWLFAIPAALVAFALALSWKVVPNSRKGSAHPFDVVGSITSLLAIGGLVLGIHEGPERGWSDPITVVGLAVGVVALLAFVAWELRQVEPLLDVRAFADRHLAMGSLTLVLVFGTMFGFMLVLFPFLQAVLGWSALRSAAGLLPMAAALLPLSTLAPQISGRIGSRATVLTGLALVAAGLSTLALLASPSGYLSILPGLLVLGAGIGLTMPPSTEAITSALPAEKQGVASALNDTSREVGGAVGIALLGSVLNAGYRNSIGSATDGLPAAAAKTAEEGIAGAIAVANELGDTDLASTARSAFVDGWVQSMWISVLIIAAGGAFAAFRGPRRSPTSRAPWLGTDRR